MEERLKVFDGIIISRNSRKYRNPFYKNNEYKQEFRNTEPILIIFEYVVDID